MSRIMKLIIAAGSVKDTTYGILMMQDGTIAIPPICVRVKHGGLRRA